MLSFEQKLEIIRSFPQLTEKKVSLGRVNFQFEDSVTEKKNVVYHLHPRGNGFVYGGDFTSYPTDEKGYVNIREFSEEELRALIQETLEELSYVAPSAPGITEIWANEEGITLTLIEEDDLFNVYAGHNLDGTFSSYGQAITYLDEEGFVYQESK